MDSIISSNVDVLIVGAGPTGLTLACDLARRGISHCIIERSDSYSVASRAKTIMPRSLEVADDLGFVESIVSKGVTDLPARYYNDKGDFIDKPGLSIPATPEQNTPYPDPVWIAEFDVEAALRARYAQLGGHVKLSTTAVELSQDDNGVTVAVAAPEGGRHVRARYVAGADGGKSTVRKLIDRPLVGHTYENQRWYLGDVRLQGLNPGRMHIWASEEGMIGLTPLPGTDIWQLQSTIPTDIEEPEKPSLELYQAMLNRRAGAENIVVAHASWLSIYRVNVRMVDSYRNGRVFLAGDAAHVHSPAGGQGMNTGMQDAYNLGWKLAAVLRGANAALLDTYDEERRPVARAVLEDSTKRLGATMKTVTDSRSLSASLGKISDDLTSGLLVSYPDSSLTRPMADESMAGPRPGDRAPDAAGLQSDGFDGSVFDLLRGPHWTLLAFTDGPLPSLSHIDRSELHVHRMARPDARAVDGFVDREGNAYRVYASNGNEAVLIRPDGYIALRCKCDDETEINDYLHSK